jgi:hypothetical protein
LSALALVALPAKKAGDAVLYKSMGYGGSHISPHFVVPLVVMQIAALFVCVTVRVLSRVWQTG